MRLRRETGDWNIKFKVNKADGLIELVTTQLPKGLSAEDFIGITVEVPKVSGNTTMLVVTEVETTLNMPFSLRAMLSNGMTVLYDRYTGKISTNADDFGPIEADFRIQFETGSSMTPTSLDAGLDADYFVGKTVLTDKGRYTITSDMIESGEGNTLCIFYTGDSAPYIEYRTNDGLLANVTGSSPK